VGHLWTASFYIEYNAKFKFIAKAFVLKSWTEKLYFSTEANNLKTRLLRLSKTIVTAFSESQNRHNVTDFVI
jgi:hypothetical protein